MSIAQTIGELLRPLRAYRRQVWVVILAIAIEMVAQTAVMPMSFKFLIDDALMPKDWDMLMLILGILAVSVVLGGVCKVGQDYIYARLGTSVVNDLRQTMFSHLQEMSADFYAKSQVAEILARFSTDLAPVESAVVYVLPAGFASLLGCCISISLLFALQWSLALVAVWCLLIFVAVTRMVEPRASRLGYELRQEQARVSVLVEESVSARPVISAFGLEQHTAAGFSEQLVRVHRVGSKSNFISYLMESVPWQGLMLCNLLLVAVGAVLVYEDVFSVGSLVAFNALFFSTSESLYGVTWAMPQLVQAGAGLRRINELLSAVPTVVDRPDAISLEAVSDTLAFEDVCFHYADQRGQLQDVSFSVPHGSKLAIVGPSGSGKSTVLKLVMRFYDPSKGAVRIDGHDLKDLQQQSLRSRIGVVFQDNILFNTTIFENIRMGKPSATEAEVSAAAKAADIDAFITGLPEGYQTVVGERGGQLSGGERQRIAIARAVIRNPDILLLDEATSALDPGTAASVEATLSRIGKGRTVIHVTHRLANVTDADLLLVMREGCIVERGTHQQLLRVDGLYASLWKTQPGIE